MIQKKLALLGTSGVGKTSLVRRFVESLFDDNYLTTIGVKVDKKLVRVGAQDVTLMVWDIAGVDPFFSVPTAYIRGASGLLLVADGTRSGSLDSALQIRADAERALGALPFVLAINKADLQSQWHIGDERIASLESGGATVLRTSAKTGDGVDRAFSTLARLMVG